VSESSKDKGASLTHPHLVQAHKRWGRLKLIGAGIALGGFGVALLGRGVAVVMHWTGQPMFSWGFIAAGLLCIALAFIPTSWVAKAADVRRTRDKNGR